MLNSGWIRVSLFYKGPKIIKIKLKLFNQVKIYSPNNYAIVSVLKNKKSKSGMFAKKPFCPLEILLYVSSSAL